ncbi:hypothetical protein C0J52_13328 [Blattella germanica]|nr:hypothetical protein C0J52_13328 [Blattella germanica]
MSDLLWPQQNFLQTIKVPYEMNPDSGNMSFLAATLLQSQQHPGNSSGPGLFPCPQCGKTYKYKRSMSAHLKVECGKEPQLLCPYCPHRSKKNHHLAAHIRAIHRDMFFSESQK